MSSLDGERVVRTWLYRGMSDLFCAFVLSEDWVFNDEERFLEIMALEKFLKSLLLFRDRQKYEGLSETDAKAAVDKLARGYGHQFGPMIQNVAAMGVVDVTHTLSSDFDGYNGAALVTAVTAGYEETRYPVRNLISDKFPIGHGWTQDPLASSGITKFVYALCGACFKWLGVQMDLSRVLQQFRQQYNGRREIDRFERLFLEANCKVRLPPLAVN